MNPVFLLKWAGLSSKDGNTEEDGLSSKISNPSVPPTPRTEGEILKSSNMKSFTFVELKTATRNFRPDSVVGEGGFGRVFKGWIDEQSLAPVRPGTGLVIAVKMLNQEGLQGHSEWLTEINYLGQLHHPNLVRLIGYCLEDHQRLLVYEFLTKGSLDNHLFRRGSYFQPLSWNIRMKVALDAAKGLAYLHSDEAKVIYRDFKASNILLDSNYNAKLSDFGLAKDGPAGDKSHVSTRVMGTYGYAAPEYIATVSKLNPVTIIILKSQCYVWSSSNAMHDETLHLKCLNRMKVESLLLCFCEGHLTKKSDVYSFGVVLLEIMSGKRALDSNRPSGEHNLIEWAKPYLSNKRRIFQVMDARIEGQYSTREAMKVANLAIQCLSVEPRFRPKMDEVVRALEELQDSGEKTVAGVGSHRHHQTGSGYRQHRGKQHETTKK
ncbi:hypothetical protein V8G54_035827 [Vigna mungo]|uniref:non-specific serine/threonine protein kinase n=1 Tax=Vigna mungo TaxID=3915 RepID=A0AAQ3RET6_VIGMU